MINKIMTLNKTSLRLTCDELTARASRDFSDLKGTECGVANGSCPTTLRLVVTLLLMVVVGVSEVKAQMVDYSGKYYIGTVNQTNGFYLCPTEDWYYYQSTSPYYTNTADEDPDKVMPFLTTYQCKSTSGYDASEAVWEIRKHESQNYYYIIHVSSGKYLTYNVAPFSNKGRVRVHLEKSPANDDYALFKIEYASASSSYDIISKYAEDNNIDPDNNKPRKYLNINKGNKQSLKGKDDKVDNIEVGGIIGLWTAGSTESTGSGRFFLEDYITRPTIGYDASGNIKITNNAASATVYYSIGENSDPKTSGTSFTGTSETLTSFTDGDIIKAVAKIGDDYSNVVTFTVVVHVGSSNQYLIQNLERTNFYMIPGDVSSNNTYVNTTSLFRPTMSWYFSDAGSVDGVQYYYIINGHTGDYLYFASNNVYMKASSVFDESDGYKFSIVQGYKAENDPDGFHIVPKAQISDNTYCIYKGGWENASTIANSKDAALKGSGNARRYEQKHTRWNFVPSSTLDKTAPFTVTDASTHITKFYKIASVGSDGYYIVPPTGNNTNATTSNSADAAVVKSGTWYFEEAQAATASDWCTYYYIRNAETGKYLYFTKDGTNYTATPKACLEMRETKSGDEDPYLFTWARTAEENVNYYIVPKKLKDVSLNTISTLQRSGTTLQSNTRRDAGDYAWTFEDAVLFCSNPVFEESGENIIISCILGSAEIHYTTNGDDPSADGVTYSVYPPTTPFSKSGKHIIRACAVVSDGATPTPNTASSDVVTLLNKPDVTLETGPYTYKGTAWEPAVTSVSIGTISTTSGYTVSYSSEHTNVGDVDVTVTDANATDTWYIMNASTSFTISPVALTVTADAKTKEYGDADPELTYTSTGLIGEDAITGALSRAEGENVGTYAISQGTLTAGNNYAITYTPANLTINRKSIGDGTTPAAGIEVNIDGDNNVTVTRTTPTTVALTKDTDFTVSDPENDEGGNQVWTITGINNYTGGAKLMRVALAFSETGANSGENVHDVTPYKASANMTIDGLDAYIVTHINMTKRKVTIKKINYVKKDEPLLLLTDLTSAVTNFTATPKHVEEGDVADTSDNLLKVSSAGGQTVGFGEVYMYYQGKFVMTTGGTLPEGKFYLDNPNPPSSSGGGGTSNAPLRIAFDETTEIEDAINNTETRDEDKWYTLDGLRLSGKPVKKGLYIKNSKKVVIK